MCKNLEKKIRTFTAQLLAENLIPVGQRLTITVERRRYVDPKTYHSFGGIKEALQASTPTEEEWLKILALPVKSRLLEALARYKAEPADRIEVKTGRAKNREREGLNEQGYFSCTDIEKLNQALEQTGLKYRLKRTILSDSGCYSWEGAYDLVCI